MPWTKRAYRLLDTETRNGIVGAISLAVGRRNSMRETVLVRPTVLRHSADRIRFRPKSRSFNLVQNERGGDEQG